MTEQRSSLKETTASRSGRMSRALREQLVVGTVLLIAGTALSGAATIALWRTPPTQLAQSLPAAGTPDNLKKDDSQSSGQTRPTTPAPEPARPPSTTGESPSAPATQPPLPPAPAEKSGTPIPEKK
jgi:cytoskeletal protein RodZ